MDGGLPVLHNGLRTSSHREPKSVVKRARLQIELISRDKASGPDTNTRTRVHLFGENRYRSPGESSREGFKDITNKRGTSVRFPGPNLASVTEIKLQEREKKEESEKNL